MKKIFFMMAFIFVFAAASFAETAGVRAWGGYTTLNMGKINENVVDMYEDSVADEKKKQEFSGSYIIGADELVHLGMGFSLGARVSYIGDSETFLSGEDTATDDTEKYSLTASLTSIMGGLVYRMVIPATPIKIGAGAFAGYGLGGGSFSHTGVNGGTEFDESVAIGGGALAADICGEVEYVVSETFSFGLTAGYRIANIAEMKATEANPELSIEKDDAFKGLGMDSDAPLPFDFGGFEAGVQLTLTY